MRNYLKLTRVHHWIKNGFIFIPAFFAGELFQLNNIIQLILGFVAFSFTASSIYILNDYRDIESDKHHPIKMKRPLASGVIPAASAIYLMLLFFLAGLGLAFL
jgi:4-hydroxybenzoate polyprenyltransferase